MKDTLRNCPRSDESKELGQTKTMGEPGPDQGPVLGTLVGY